MMVVAVVVALMLFPIQCLLLPDPFIFLFYFILLYFCFVLFCFLETASLAGLGFAKSAHLAG